MSRIRSAGNETTELRLVRLLRQTHLNGWRRNYRIFGKPDFVWPQERVVLFVDGCFWHGCPRHGHTPKSNLGYWRRKLARNRKRDQVVTEALRRDGWRVIRVWECRLKSPRSNSVLRRLQKLLPS